MIAIKNLLFQPLTFQLAGEGQGLHLGPRERREIGEEHVSAELKTAAGRGLVTLPSKPAEPRSRRSSSPSDLPSRPPSAPAVWLGAPSTAPSGPRLILIRADRKQNHTVSPVKGSANDHQGAYPDLCVCSAP